MIFKVRNNGIGAKRTKILVASAHYFMDNMIKGYQSNITVFRYFMDHSSEQHGDYGYQTELSALPGHYTISISKDSRLKEAIEFCAHEFVHLKQTLSGTVSLIPTFRKRGESEWFWHGRSYGIDPYDRYLTRESHIKYLPWEKEAYDNQKRWARKFFESDYFN